MNFAPAFIPLPEMSPLLTCKNCVVFPAVARALLGLGRLLLRAVVALVRLVVEFVVGVFLLLLLLLAVLVLVWAIAAFALPEAPWLTQTTHAFVLVDYGCDVEASQCWTTRYGGAGWCHTDASCYSYASPRCSYLVPCATRGERGDFSAWRLTLEKFARQPALNLYALIKRYT